MQKKRIVPMAVMAVACVSLAACAQPKTAAERARQDHEIACMAGTVAGALVGAAVGSRFGGGVGQTILTGAGGGIGAVAGRRLACGE